MWYYVRNNQRIGPVDENTLISLIQNGTIERQTLVWKEGMADWIRADACQFADKFSAIPPTPPGISLTSYVPSETNYTPESFHKLWLWYAWLICLGAVFSFILIGIPALIAAIVIGYILLYRFWSLIQDGKARTSPGVAVGFCFIPLFNLYWMYVAWVGLAKDMNLYCRERNINCVGVNEDLALAWFIVTLTSVIPYIGVLTAIAAIVIGIILLKQFVETSKAIIISKTKSSCEALPLA
jgi:hypothetical protein